MTAFTFTYYLVSTQNIKMSVGEETPGGMCIRLAGEEQ